MYFVRPVSHGDYGVYEYYAKNRAKVVFEGTQKECYEWVERCYELEKRKKEE